MIRGYTGLAVCGVAHAHTHADTRARTHAHTRTRAHTHTHALRIRGRSHWVIISHWTMFKDISSLCGGYAHCSSTYRNPRAMSDGPRSMSSER